MAETLTVSEMLPNKFEPKRNYRWVLAIEGIDSFLINSSWVPDSEIMPLSKTIIFEAFSIVESL